MRKLALVAALTIGVVGRIAWAEGEPAAADETAQTSAEKTEEAATHNLMLRDWYAFADATGQLTDVSGSLSKFLEDYTLLDGGGGSFTAGADWADGRSLRMEAQGLSGEDQGYFVGHYGKLDRYSVRANVTALQRFYNTSTGGPDQVASGVPIPGNFFPGSNDTRSVPFFGSDIPSINRIDMNTYGDYQPKQVLHDGYANFRYYSVNGDETLLKGGTIDDQEFRAPGGGPGTAAFDFPSRKAVDYETIGGFTGARSPAGGINWQTDASYEYTKIKSNLTEPIFGISLQTTELDFYRENSNVQVVKYDLVASRFFGPKLYTYGGYLFSFERSDPSPTQSVAIDAADPPQTTVDTRSSSGGEVHRLSNTLSLGLIFRPFERMVMVASSRTRGHTQFGELTQNRDEFLFPVGDVGTIFNESDRSWVDQNVDLTTHWRIFPRALARLRLRYRFRWQNVDQSRIFELVQLELPALEDYTNRYHRVEASPSLRWRAGRGKSVELGYRFLFEDMNVSVDQLENQIIMNDYIRRRHTPYLKGTIRLMRNLRGQLRFEYIIEQRDLNAPLIEPGGFAAAAGGETEWTAWRVIPGLFYLPHRHLSLFGAISVGRQRLSIQDLGPVPADFNMFSSFEYDAMTETLITSMSYSPSETWSGSLSYNFLTSDRSVGNDLHRVEISGRYYFTKRWGVHGGYRYLRFDQDITNIDDYRANVFFFGVTGRF